MQRTIQSCFLSTLAAAVGLLTVLIIGRISWTFGSGIVGIIIGATTAVLTASFLRVRLQLTVSMFASGFAAFIACFLAIATAEQLPPGSAEWMWKGGIYGACVGLPLAFILGTLGLIEGNAVRDPASVEGGSDHEN